MQVDTVAAHTNEGWMLDIEGTLRQNGTTANFMWAGM